MTPAVQRLVENHTAPVLANKIECLREEIEALYEDKSTLKAQVASAIARHQEDEALYERRGRDLAAATTLVEKKNMLLAQLDEDNKNMARLLGPQPTKYYRCLSCKKLNDFPEVATAGACRHCGDWSMRREPATPSLIREALGLPEPGEEDTVVQMADLLREVPLLVAMLRAEYNRRVEGMDLWQVPMVQFERWVSQVGAPDSSDPFREPAEEYLRLVDASISPRRITTSTFSARLAGRPSSPTRWPAFARSAARRYLCRPRRSRPQTRTSGPRRRATFLFEPGWEFCCLPLAPTLHSRRSQPGTTRTKRLDRPPRAEDTSRAGIYRSRGRSIIQRRCTAGDRMAQKYRKKDPRFWDDEKVKKLTIAGKLLADWLLTSSRVNRCGVVLFSPGLASEQTGIPLGEVDTLCHTVCDTLNWPRDPASKTVFLRRWWKYNKPDNLKALKGALSDLHDLPTNSLKPHLASVSNDLPDKLQAFYLQTLDTVSHTVSDTVSPQEQEQEQEQKSKTPLPPRGGEDEKKPDKPSAKKFDPRAVPIPDELRSDRFEATWAMWLAERTAPGAKGRLTENAVHMQFKKLLPLGPDRAADCVEASIANRWQGLFPEKFGEQPRGGGGYRSHDQRIIDEINSLPGVH